MGQQLFNGTLAASFVAGDPMLLVNDTLTVDFQITVADAVADVEWYPEYASDPAATSWFRELAEEDVGSGVVNMPKVVRHFQENGGASLAIGTHTVNAQLLRRHLFVRLQMACSSVGATVNVVATAVFGLPARVAT